MSLKNVLMFAPVVALALFTQAPAYAQQTTTTNQHVHKTSTTTTTVESDEDDPQTSTTAPMPPADQPSPQAPAAPTQDFLMTSKFGSQATTGMAGCKTEEVAKGVVRDLKADCQQWINEHKKELKSKYQTGTCEQDCSDCGMSLQRCTVTGTIHYAK